MPASAGTLGAALDRCVASGEGEAIEVTMRTADGLAEGRPLQLEIRNLSADPLLDGLIVTGHDVSDLRVARHKLEFLAGHDELTGLANRSLLLTHMTAMVTAGEPLAILFIDLDHFKPINDVLGHEAGDELLQCVSRRLELSTRPGDIVARVGGDEFVVLAPGIQSQDVADKMVQRLEDAIGEPFELRSGPVRIGASAGIMLSDASSTVEGLLAGADMAMYDAKTSRRGGAPRSALPASSPELRRRLIHELSVGMRRGEVVAFVQPIVHLGTGRVTAVEALARWQHPRLGLLLPGSFIDLAEDANLDVELGERILDSACETVRNACLIMPGLNLCINLSAGQLAEPGLGATVVGRLTKAGLTPDRLIVEITERVTLTRRRTRSGAPPESALHDLRRLGIKLSLDDFGTGHSSLTHLRSYPLASIKIDRHFVAGMVDHPEDLAVVAAVVGLGTALGLWVVAEAVETDTQLRMLREMGCSHAQGNIISPALPPPPSSSGWHDGSVVGADRGSVLRLEPVVERDDLGGGRDAAGELRDEVVATTDVEGPEVHVGRDEPSTVVRPEQVGAAPVVERSRVAQLGHRRDRPRQQVVDAVRELEAGDLAERGEDRSVVSFVLVVQPRPLPLEQTAGRIVERSQPPDLRPPRAEAVALPHRQPRPISAGRVPFTDCGDVREQAAVRRPPVLDVGVRGGHAQDHRVLVRHEPTDGAPRSSTRACDPLGRCGRGRRSDSVTEDHRDTLVRPRPKVVPGSRWHAGCGHPTPACACSSAATSILPIFSIASIVRLLASVE